MWVRVPSRVLVLGIISRHGGFFSGLSCLTPENRPGTLQHTAFCSGMRHSQGFAREAGEVVRRQRTGAATGRARRQARDEAMPPVFLLGSSLRLRGI